MRQMGGSAIRIGLLKHDVTKTETLEALKQIVEELKKRRGHTSFVDFRAMQSMVHVAKSEPQSH